VARISTIRIENYRSIREVDLAFPESAPLVLIGENNAGKSNIVRAIDLVCGEMWPSSYEPADNEFYKRNREKVIRVEAGFLDPLGRHERIWWQYDNGANEPCVYRGDGGYIRGEERSELIAVTIGADRRLSYQTGYSSKYTMLSKLIHRFHKAMLDDEGVRERLQEIFQQTKDSFVEIEAFATFRANLKDGFSDLISSMTHKLEVDFEAYNPVNFFHALRLHASESGEPRTLDELGTGEEQLLALAFAHAYAKAFHGGLVFIIEEPEAHLHPLAQEWLARKVRSVASDGLQIVLTTHAQSFVDFLNIEGLAVVSKTGDETTVRQTTVPELGQWCEQHGARVTNIDEFYDACATQEVKSGLFARRVVLVEGTTESLSLPWYLSAVGLDCVKEGVAVVPVGGKGNLAKWWRLFTAYGLPTYVIFDNDDDDDRRGIKRTDILTTLGEGDIQAVLAGDGYRLSACYSVFGRDFESTLREWFDGYGEIEQTGRRFLQSDSKPLVARYVARQLSNNVDAGAGWTHMRRLAQRIRRVTAPD